MQALLRLTYTEFKLLLREPAAVFFTLAFPVLVVLLFGSIFGGYPVRGTPLTTIDLYTPAYTGLVIGTVALIGLPTTLASYRERGVLRRLRATPLGPTRILAAHVLVNFVMTLAGIGLLITAAALFLGLQMPHAPGMVFIAITLSSLSFFAVGFLVASLFPSVRVAQAVGQAVFFPMFFLSGSALPLDQMPGWLRSVSDYIPLTYVVRLVQEVWIGDGWNWMAAAILLAILALATLLTARVFRWE
ncbi:ABC transporter permease [Rubrobacter aplysinae]|uniref:ABC transporter permease n=1 Tax=Rubrobacter aplysinae TaxID=909625 RepID=UPI00064C2C59|nr:ABC transporter permease [Rubrobacter aplysinae]